MNLVDYLKFVAGKLAAAQAADDVGEQRRLAKLLRDVLNDALSEASFADHVRAAVDAVEDVDWFDACQECGVAHSDAWRRLRALVGPRDET